MQTNTWALTLFLPTAVAGTASLLVPWKINNRFIRVLFSYLTFIVFFVLVFALLVVPIFQGHRQDLGDTWVRAMDAHLELRGVFDISLLIPGPAIGLITAFHIGWFRERKIWKSLLLCFGFFILGVGIMSIFWKSLYFAL